MPKWRGLADTDLLRFSRLSIEIPLVNDFLLLGSLIIHRHSFVRRIEQALLWANSKSLLVVLVPKVLALALNDNWQICVLSSVGADVTS